MVKVVSWRPEGWDDIEGHITYEINERYADKPLLAIAKAVEAGADALLQSLRKLEIKDTDLRELVELVSRRPHAAKVRMGTLDNKPGRLVFLPDDNPFREIEKL